MVLLGMAMFAVIVFRTSGLERETRAEAGPANREIRPALSELGSS
jgi:hypothetical protein